MSTESIDINCDMGESYGNVIIGNDAIIFPHITSCNIACGFHGGDPVQMERTIKLALQYNVQIGAHPSYPDREGFGRRRMHISSADLQAVMRYQISALYGMTKALGGTLRYVKPHGALYNAAADEEAEATAIVESILSCQSSLALMGLAGSAMEHVAHQYGIAFIREAFADRRYESNGRLVPRSTEGSVIEDPLLAAEQVLSLIQHKEVTAIDGQKIRIEADSICVHGDHKHTPEILTAIDEQLYKHGIKKNAVDIDRISS